jgi:TonB-linked SusC/RagA family outer membrane protein
VKGSCLSICFTVALQAQALALPISSEIAVNSISSKENAVALLDQVIKGRVTDEKGDGLPGVSIIIQGTQRGTVTDISGNFEITTSSSADILVFSYVGFLGQEIVAGNQTNIEVKLANDNKQLEEIVVVGYGVQKKATVTGSISSVKGGEIAQVPAPNISQSLAGRVAGVSMRPNGGQPGKDDPDIHIRGIVTTGNNQPLVVVDGVRRNNIRQIDPSSIENITILKDAAAVAPYGIGGANGVILITTKKGKTGKPSIRVSTSYGIQNPTYLPKVLNAKDYMTLQNEAYFNLTPDGTTPPNQPDLVRDYDRLHQEDPWKYPNSNFLEIFNKNVPMQNHNVELSGGTEHVTYLAGLGYYDQKGIFDPVGYRRYTYNMNLEMSPTKTTKVGMSVHGSLERTSDIDPDESTSGHLFRSFYKFLPTQTLLYPEGDKWGESSANTPVGVLRSPGYKKTNGNTMLGSLYVEQQLFKGLSIKGVFSYDPNQNSIKSWHIPFLYHKIDLTSKPYTYTDAISLQEGGGKPFRWLEQENRDRANYTYQGYLNYAGTFGSHHVTGLVVVEARTSSEQWFRTRRNNFSVGIDEIGFGSSNKLDYDNDGSSSTGSELGYVYRLGYTYKDKYMIEASGRYDGHYYFAPGKRWGYFPAFSAAWRISEESFMKNQRAINELKLRGSWGKAGMLAGDPFQYQSGYDLRGNAYGFGTGTLVQGSRVPREANTQITWEISKKTNVGFDMNLWNSLLTLEFDYFTESRTGMLLAPQVTLPVEYGLALSQENKGRMSSRGFEVSLGTRKKYSSDLDFSIFGNFSYAKNKMLEVFETDAERKNPNRTKVGRPFDTPYGYKSQGLFTTADDKNGDGIINGEDGYNVTQFGDLHPGDIRYQDLSGPNGVPDGVINDFDLAVIGAPVYPAISYGITPSANYKGFDLSLFFQGSAQSSISVRQFLTVPFENNGSNTGYEYYDNRWTPENQGAKYPRSTPSPYANNTKDSDFWWMNSSYIRLKTVSLGYTLPKPVLEKLKLGNARIYVISQNLFTASKIKHIDPEMGYTDRETAYPVMKTTTLGLDISF